jgi:tRNA A22 N-methylase
MTIRYTKIAVILLLGTIVNSATADDTLSSNATSPQLTQEDQNKINAQVQAQLKTLQNKINSVSENNHQYTEAQIQLLNAAFNAHIKVLYDQFVKAKN